MDMDIVIKSGAIGAQTYLTSPTTYVPGSNRIGLVMDERDG